MLYHPLLPLAVLLMHIAYLRYHYGRLNPFSFYLLIDITLLFICIYPQYSDFDLFASESESLKFNTLLAASIGLLIVCTHIASGASTRISLYTLNLTTLERIPPSVRRLFPWALLMFFGCTLYVVNDTVRTSGKGFWQYFTSERLTVYLEGDTEVSIGVSISYFTMVALRPILWVWICLLWSEKNWKIGWLVYSVILVAMLMIFRTRLEVLITLAMPLVFFHYFRRRLRVWQFAVGFVGFLALLAALNIWRGVGLGSFLRGDVDLTEYYTESFNQDLNPSRALIKLYHMDELGIIEYEYGLNYWYTVVTFVPRAFWPNKPITSLEVRWTLLLKEDIRQGVQTFTVFGEGIIQFGWLGMLGGSAIYGLLYGTLHKIFGTRKLLVLAWFYFAVLAATYIRASVQATVFLAVVYWGPVIVLSFLSRRGGDEATA